MENSRHASLDFLLEAEYRVLLSWDSTGYGDYHLSLREGDTLYVKEEFASCPSLSEGWACGFYWQQQQMVSGWLPPAYVTAVFQIETICNGQVLTIPNHCGIGDKPFLAPWNGGDNQLWIQTLSGALKSVLNGLVLDVDPYAHGQPRRARKGGRR